jgi:hypothetical protein
MPRPRSKAYWQVIAFNTLLKIYLKTANYEMVRVQMKDHWPSAITSAKTYLPPVVYVVLYSSAHIAYFTLEDYQNAEAVIMDTININHFVQRDDTLYLTSMFHLLVLYEQRNYYRLSQVINASYAMLYNKKKLQPFEKEIMLFFKSLLNVREHKEVIKAMASFLKRLDVYKNDPLKEMYFIFFNYYGWLESKVMGIKYTDYVKRNLLKKQEQAD